VSVGCTEVRSASRLGGTRRIVEVIFTYTNRQTDVDEKSFVRVDVTEEFPFLVTKMSPYYDR
jgi:PatG C-terminal